MAKVFIPTLLREFTGREEVEAQGETVRQVIDSLDQQFPGIRDRLIEGGRLRRDVSVAVDGEVTPLGLAEAVPSDCEIHFVTAIRGGSSSPATNIMSW